MIILMDGICHNSNYGRSSNEPGERSPNISPALHFQSGASSQNRPKSAHALWITMWVSGCYVMTLHFENVRLGWGWAVAHWIGAFPLSIISNLVIPSCTHPVEFVSCNGKVMSVVSVEVVLLRDHTVAYRLDNRLPVIAQYMLVHL